MTTGWLTEAEMRSWRAFIDTLPNLMATFEADLAGHGLTMGDYEVLVCLSEADDNRMRMCDLAGALRLSPSGLTRRLDGLVKAGWVHRAASDCDRRVMFAHLTDEGRHKMEETAPDHVASVRTHFLSPLGAEGVQQLGVLFRKVQAHLNEVTAT